MSYLVLNMYPNSTLRQIGNLHHAAFDQGTDTGEDFSAREHNGITAAVGQQRCRYNLGYSPLELGMIFPPCTPGAKYLFECPSFQTGPCTSDNPAEEKQWCWCFGEGQCSE